MINTYNLFATTIVHGKFTLQPKLHKKILSCVDSKILSSVESRRSIINGHQIHDNFEGKKELDNLLNTFLLNTYRVKISHSWLNILTNYSYNKPHAHKGDNINLSAVYYLSSLNNNITFVKEQETFEIRPKLFDFLIFPYNLVHYVLPEDRQNPRISYSFNLETIEEK